MSGYLRSRFAEECAKLRRTEKERDEAIDRAEEAVAFAKAVTVQVELLRSENERLRDVLGVAR